jgi:hypothetical protein
MRFNTNKSDVTSLRGLNFYIVCLGCLIAGTFGVVSLITKLGKLDFSRPFDFLGNILLSYLLWYSFSLFNSKIIVSSFELTISTFLATNVKSWNGIKEIRFITNFFGRYNVVVTWEDLNARNGIYSRVLPVSIFGNMKELSQTLVEAAYRANPNLILNEFTLEMLGGYPPYRVFREK